MVIETERTGLMSQDPPTPLPTMEEFRAEQKEKREQAIRLQKVLQIVRGCVYGKIKPTTLKQRLMYSTFLRGISSG